MRVIVQDIVFLVMLIISNLEVRIILCIIIILLHMDEGHSFRSVMIVYIHALDYPCTWHCSFARNCVFLVTTVDTLTSEYHVLSLCVRTGISSWSVCYDGGLVCGHS